MRQRRQLPPHFSVQERTHALAIGSMLEVNYITVTDLICRPHGWKKTSSIDNDFLYKVWKGHMEKQETEIKQKLEMETGNGNRKLKTEIEMQLLRCCSPSKI